MVLGQFLWRYQPLYYSGPLSRRLGLGEARAGLDPGGGFSAWGRKAGGLEGSAQGALGALAWEQAPLELMPVAVQSPLLVQAPGENPLPQ